jgi:hypothetical protein
MYVLPRHNPPNLTYWVPLFTARSWILLFAVFFVLLAILFQIYGVPNELKAVFS